MTIRRRTLLGTAAVLPLAGLTACRGGTQGPSDPDARSLRFGFWGNDLRVQAFGEVIDLFQEANPGVEVQTETGDFGPYFERLAVQTAGDDAPDVISMDFAYLREYADRGALLDLAGTGLDTSGFPEAMVETGVVGDALYGLAHGMGAATMLTRASLVDELGIDLPDDSTWVWDDLVTVAAEIGRASGGDVAGLGGRTFLQALAFRSFLAERGTGEFTADGTIGFDAGDLVDWWALMQRALDEGAIGSPAAIVEESGTEVDQSGLATGTVAIDTWWSNQLTAMNSASGEELRLLRLPSEAGSAPPVVLQPTVYWTISAGAADPELAASLIQFFTSEPAAARIILTDRGLPANDAAREAITEELTDADRATLDYVGEDSDLAVPFPPPVGGSTFGDVYGRVTTDLAFGRTTPQAAAEAVLTELQAAIGG